MLSIDLVTKKAKVKVGMLKMSHAEYRMTSRGFFFLDRSYVQTRVSELSTFFVRVSRCWRHLQSCNDDVLETQRHSNIYCGLWNFDWRHFVEQSTSQLYVGMSYTRCIYSRYSAIHFNILLLEQILILLLYILRSFFDRRVFPLL